MGLGYNVIDALFDKRNIVTTPEKHPWSIHGYLRCVFADGTVHRGTGTMISKDCLLTAGHCLYNEDAKEEALKLPISITYFSGLYEDKHFFKTEYQKVFIHTAYKESNDENFDFGIVQLEKSIGDYTGWALVQALDDKNLHSLKINITGYPAHVSPLSVLMKRPLYSMYTMQGSVQSVRKHKFYYNLDTSGGQSGAGVWTLNEEGNVVCTGIHVTGSKLEGNGAIRINDENLETIKNWLDMK